jgi:hypothetical protein
MLFISTKSKRTTERKRDTVSVKTSYRRAQGTAKLGGRAQHTELDMTAWVVTNSQGIDTVVYTLGHAPQGYRKAVARAEG